MAVISSGHARHLTSPMPPETLQISIAEAFEEVTYLGIELGPSLVTCYQAWKEVILAF